MIAFLLILIAAVWSILIFFRIADGFMERSEIKKEKDRLQEQVYQLKRHLVDVEGQLDSANYAVQEKQELLSSYQAASAARWEERPRFTY